MVCNLVTYVYHNARFKKRKVYYITCMFVKLYNWKYVVTEGHKYLSREPHVGQYWSKQWNASYVNAIHKQQGEYSII